MGKASVPWDIIGSFSHTLLGGGDAGTGASHDKWWVKVTAAPNAATNFSHGADMKCTQNVYVDSLPAGAYSGKVKARVKVLSKLQDKASGYGVKIYNDGILNPNSKLTVGVSAGITVTFTAGNTPVYEVALAGAELSIISSDNAVAKMSKPNLMEVDSTQLNGSQHVLSTSTQGAQPFDVAQAQPSTYTVGDSTSKATISMELSGAAAYEGGQSGAWVDLSLVQGYELYYDLDDQGSVTLVP
jgi:hypothetical protein